MYSTKHKQLLINKIVEIKKRKGIHQRPFQYERLKINGIKLCLMDLLIAENKLSSL